MDFPRHVHRAGAHLIVLDDEAYERALRDGWSPDPVAVTVTKGDETWVVYTADSLATAIADGWTVSMDSDAPIASSIDASSDVAPARKRTKK